MEEEEEEGELAIELFHLQWREVGGFVVFVGFVILSAIAKIGFHHLHWVSSRVPESCLLVLVGLTWALVLEYASQPGKFDLACAFPEFTPELFFHFLLPPIILEAAYSLYNKARCEQYQHIKMSREALTNKDNF